jgi:uncharacterized protein YndB with AHSA1/START domain
MADRTISKTIHIAAPPEMVWDYLTKADLMGKWFHKPESDLAPGAAISMIGKDGNPICWGTVEEMQPHTRLAFSFSARPMNGLMTRVDWSLHPDNGGTRLDLTHSGFQDGAEGFGLLVAFDKGWDGHLVKLREI